MITPSQCRAARAIIGLSRKEVAQAANVAERTLVDFERGARQPYARTLKDVKIALEEAGVEFIDENGGGAGVRLKKG
jgi:transcriptional regulator with XRE-family HTH domain